MTKDQTNPKSSGKSKKENFPKRGFQSPLANISHVQEKESTSSTKKSPVLSSSFKSSAKKTPAQDSASKSRTGVKLSRPRGAAPKGCYWDEYNGYVKSTDQTKNNATTQKTNKRKETSKREETSKENADEPRKRGRPVGSKNRVSGRPTDSKKEISVNRQEELVDKSQIESMINAAVDAKLDEMLNEKLGSVKESMINAAVDAKLDEMLNEKLGSVKESIQDVFTMLTEMRADTGK